MARSVVSGGVLTQLEKDGSAIKGRPLGPVPAGGIEETPNGSGSAPAGPPWLHPRLYEPPSDWPSLLADHSAEPAELSFCLLGFIRGLRGPGGCRGLPGFRACTIVSEHLGSCDRFPPLSQPLLRAAAPACPLPS